MKAFEISHTPKPKTGRFRSYAGLSFTQEEDVRLLRRVGNGRPFDGEWKPISLYVLNPSWPRPDFFGLPGGLVCSEAILKIAGEPLEMCGELLPVTIEGEDEKFYFFHITISYNAVDKEKSEWTTFEERKGVRLLTKPAFIGERLGEESLFKIPEDFFVRNYCLERTEDPEDGEFKALVEHHKLTGLEFKLIWSDEKT